MENLKQVMFKLPAKIANAVKFEACHRNCPQQEVMFKSIVAALRASNFQPVKDLVKEYEEDWINS